jgi:hypothetical protein
VWSTPQSNIELMSQEEILDFKPSPQPEQVDDSRPKQMEDDSIASDRAIILPHRANPRGYDFRERQVLKITHGRRYGRTARGILRAIFRRNSSGSFATLAAIRRASCLVSSRPATSY